YEAYMKAYATKYDNDSYDLDANPPTAEELRHWERWMKEVFMPQNEQIYGLIITKTDLLKDRTIPECLLQICSHVAAYRAVLTQWETEQDYSERHVVIPYPADIFEYCKSSY